MNTYSMKPGFFKAKGSMDVWKAFQSPSRPGSQDSREGSRDPFALADVCLQPLGSTGSARARSSALGDRAFWAEWTRRRSAEGS